MSSILMALVLPISAPISAPQPLRVKTRSPNPNHPQLLTGNWVRSVKYQNPHPSAHPPNAVPLRVHREPMSYQPANPLIVQGDHTILAEVASPFYTQARDALARFAELVKAPEHVHTYRLTPLSIWNACAAGVAAAEIAETLIQFSKYPVPEHVLIEIRDYASRYGRLKLLRDPRGLVLEANDEFLAEQISRNKHVAPWLGVRFSPLEFAIAPAARGEIKQALIKAGFPAEDLAGYSEGETLPFNLRQTTLSGQPFSLRTY